MAKLLTETKVIKTKKEGEQEIHYSYPVFDDAVDYDKFYGKNSAINLLNAFIKKELESRIRSENGRRKQILSLLHDFFARNTKDVFEEITGESS